MSTADDPPSREASDYTYTDHVEHDVLPDPMRFIDETMISETIRAGTDFPHEGGPGKVRRKFDYDGVYAVAVLATDSPVVVTAWTEVNSWIRAMASDRWSQSDLETIRAFEDREHMEREWK